MTFVSRARNWKSLLEKALSVYRPSLIHRIKLFLSFHQQKGHQNHTMREIRSPGITWACFRTVTYFSNTYNLLKLKQWFLLKQEFQTLSVGCTWHAHFVVNKFNQQCCLVSHHSLLYYSLPSNATNITTNYILKKDHSYESTPLYNILTETKQ